MEGQDTVENRDEAQGSKEERIFKPQDSNSGILRPLSQLHSLATISNQPPYPRDLKLIFWAQTRKA